MDLNNITPEQQKGLEFLKARFMSELEDIKGKIVQLNKPFPDDLTTHLQNSFLNKELLFPPSQQIGLKKDQRKEQLDRLKGDENERQYLGRIKLSLEKFADAGMRQDLENKLLGIVQNPKLTSNKRMSAFFVLMHSLGFGFKRTSDFIVWAFGQMWVYENRRIAKERKSKMKKSKQESKGDKNKNADSKTDGNDNDDEDGNQDDNSNDSEKQKEEKNSEQNENSNAQRNHNDNYQLGLGQSNLNDLNIQQQQQFLSQLPIGNNDNLMQGGGNLNFYDGGSPKNKENFANMDRKELEQKIEILTRQVNIYNMLQNKQEDRIKGLHNQIEEKNSLLTNHQDSMKMIFSEFLVQLLQILNQSNVSQDVIQKVQNLHQQHLYILQSQNNNSSNNKSSYDQNYDDISGILGQKKVKQNNYNDNNNTHSQQMNSNLMDQNNLNLNLDLNSNFQNFPKIETKVEHLQLNPQSLGLNNNNGGIYQGMGLNTGQLSMNNINGLQTTLPNYNILGNDFQHADFSAYVHQNNLLGKDQ